MLRRLLASIRAKAGAASSAAGHDQTPEALFRTGTELARQGRLVEAVLALEHAVELSPGYAEAHYNLGSAYRDRGDREAALAAYRRVAELVPGYAEVHVDIGLLLRELGRFDEAAQSLARALALKPGHAQAHVELGHLHTAAGDWQQALAEFRAAAQAGPDSVRARWAAVMAELPAIEEREGQFAERRQAFARELEALDRWLTRARPQDAYDAVAVHQPFFLAYHEYPNRELLARYGGLCTQLMKTWPEGATLPAAKRRPRGAIRIGIVSAHVSNHSVWTAIGRGWLERLNPQRFQVYVFHLSTHCDAETRFAESRAHAYETGQRSFEEWARLIAERRIDVLLYPEIGMDAPTAKLASLRLARVQAVSWGHPETSGLPTIDYFLSAAQLEPPGAQENYSERLEVLPNLGCWLRRDAATAAPSPPPEAHGPGPLLVCAGMPFKYTALHDRLLIDIVQRLPECTLLFFRNRPEALSLRLERRLRYSFRRAGIEFERYVRFVPWQSLEAFRAVLAHADLYLDTVGFSGFNTALHAVQSGLPVLTREGRFLRGRLASGILRRIGVEELIAPSDERYVDLAAELARDPARLASLRGRIAGGRERLWEDAAPIEALQRFLERVGRG